MDPHPPADVSSARPWWREGEVACLLVLVVVGYFLRAGELPLRGEEPTRAQMAFEMVHRGDWLVPREQGEPFLIRPPLQNWIIAGSCLALGSWNEWAVRFPSLLATLLTTLMIYGYARTFLKRFGALAAAVAFATMADVFKMGLYAETEALFIFLVSAALLTWHGGLTRRWPEAATYAASYGWMALAMLTKGLQAPAYFLAATSIYVVLAGQWRRLFCRGQLVGIAVWALILLAWVLPYAQVMGWPAVRLAWTGDPAVGGNTRITSWVPAEVAVHLVTYPLEVFAGMLPWSLMLLAYLRADFRRTIGAARPQVLFLAVCLAVAFPTCWIPPGGQARFFAPFFPCLAVLIGLAIQRCTEAEAGTPLRAAWTRYQATLAICMALAAAALLGLAAFGAARPVLAPLAEPPLVALAYAVAAVCLAVVLLRVRAGGAPAAPVAVLALGGFLVLAFTGVTTDVRVRRAEDPAGDVQRLKARLPPGQPLVSFGHLDCLFPYYYGAPIITPRPWPARDVPDTELTYFCFNSPGESRPALPFAWEEIGTVSLDRNHNPVPERVVVVGRRIAGASNPLGAQKVSGPAAP